MADKMRTVMLAAPCYDGKIEVWHAASLADTCKIGLTKNINVCPVYLSYDAMLPRARNDIMKIAYETGVDDLFFIDTDQDWNPDDFFRLLDHNVSVVGGPVCKKSDIEDYNVRLEGDYKIQDNGLAIVDGVGTGFLRIRKDAIVALWESEYKEYTEPGKTPTKSIFEFVVDDGKLYSEDIVFCNKLNNLGINVYIDPLVKCGHIGPKRWVGDFHNWIKLHRPIR